MIGEKLESIVRKFLDLWSQLHDDGPCSIDLCEESAGDLMTLHHRLTKAGVEFIPAFNEYITRLHRICAVELESDDNQF